MRYVKAFLLILIFFVTMIFLFQNQASLSQKLAFQLDLLVMPSMTSIELPFYFVLLAAFLLGALLCLLLLLWDRMRLSAQIVRANWRVQAMQNEERKLLAQMERLATLPRESRLKLLSHFMKDKEKKNDAQEQAEATLQSLATALSEGRRADPAALRDHILHSIACKAAIKAGWHTTDAELADLVAQVLYRPDIQHCPHGRPVCITVTRSQLERRFGRG